MCNSPGIGAGEVGTAGTGVARGREGLCLGPSRVGLAETDSFHAITEFSGLFRQSKGGNGGSFAKVTKKGGEWGNKERKPKNAD